MTNLSQSTLTGWLIADPILWYTENEIPVVSFRLKNGKQADFIICVAWEGLAEVCGQYLKKGQRVAVEGHIQNKWDYQDKDHQKGCITEVVISTMQILDEKIG